MQDEFFSIGALAKNANVNIQTIRYYERIQILTPKLRRAGKQTRYYNHESLATLLFIRNSQQLGFNLGEIKQLLELRSREENRCLPVHQQALVKLEDLRAKIDDLRRMEQAIGLLVAKCEGVSKLNDCPIIGGITAMAVAD